jgi:hypothetical protein
VKIRIDTEQGNSGSTDRVDSPEIRCNSLKARVWSLAYCACLIAMLVQCMILIARRPWFVIRRTRTYAKPATINAFQ